MSEYSVYICVVTYNAEKYIDFFAGKIFPLPSNWKFFVVDNASTDKTCEIISSKYPEIFLIKNVQNLGFGKANNIFLQKAYADNVDFVFLLNQDAQISKEDITECIKVQKKCNFFIVSPVHFNKSFSDLDFSFSTYILPNYCPRLYADAIKKDIKDFYECNFVNAAGWLLSYECLNTIGGFNPIFIHYGEDDEYGNRVKYHNGKIAIAANAYLMHDRIYNTSKKYTVSKNNTREYAYYLIKLTDINKIYTMFDCFKDIMKQIIKYVIRLRISAALQKIKLLINISKVSKEIVETKSQLILTNPHFIKNGN